VGDDIEVASELTGPGRYQCTVAAEGTTRILDAAAARGFAWALITAGVTAAHDAAVVEQLTRTVGVPAAAAATVMDLRADRPGPEPATAPLQLTPLVAKSDGRGIVALTLPDQRQVGQLEPLDAINLAAHILCAQVAADLDTAYHHHLTTLVGLDDGQARRLVEGLNDLDDSEFTP
jgi:hypothetical protein